MSLTDNYGDSHLNIRIKLGSLEFDIWFDKRFMPIKSNHNIESHNHSQFEIHYIIGGMGTLFIDQREHPLKPNTWHAIGPGMYHAIRQTRHDVLIRSYLQFSCNVLKHRSATRNDEESIKIQDILGKLKYICHEDATRHIQWIQEIHYEIDNQRIGNYSRIQCLLTLIILDLIREIEPNSHVDFLLPKQTKDEQRSSLIDNFFDQYNEQITIGQLAQILNLSTKQTNRVIYEQFQTTFKQKLLDTRIEVAKNFLLTTELSVQEISERVGYSLHRSFVHIFKRKNKLTPVEYRRAMKLTKQL